MSSTLTTVSYITAFNYDFEAWLTLCARADISWENESACVFTTHIEKLLKLQRVRHIKIRITKGRRKVFWNVNELHNEIRATDNDNLKKSKLLHITLLINMHKP